MTHARPLARLVSGFAAIAMVATLGLVLDSSPAADTAAPSNDGCPPGSARYDATRPEAIPPQSQLPAQYRGPELSREKMLHGKCLPRDKWESFAELAMRDMQAGSIRAAGLGFVPNGANVAAARQRTAMFAQQSQVPGAGGTAEPYGNGPLIFDDPRFEQGSGTGIVDSTGRIDDFKYDAASNRLFAAIGTGGVWMSEDFGDTWVPLTDELPSTVASAVAYSSAGGPDGTIIVLTGEHTFGGFAFTGIGAWYSRDLGQTWTQSEGVPDGTLGFAIEVDAANPNVVYAATGKGLWRSEDAGVSFTDVELPTGDCAADYNDDTCLFANFVTDVVVKAPDGTGADANGTDVVAVVGWRAGTAEDPDGFIQSPRNGVYRSETGEPGTFEYADGLAMAANGQERLGRIELGPATGDAQDHDYLYAIVEDAVLFNGGFRSVDVPEDDPVGGNPTVFNGVYASADFGVTWNQLADDVEMSDACLVNQSVYCIPGLIEPGAQSWYNMWVTPDPTATDPLTHAPTRVLLGLEEIWQTRLNGLPQTTQASTFEVIGSYYGGIDCLLAATNCGVNKPLGTTTTHPDQHAGLLVPTPGGAASDVTLFVGHDGGLSRQVAGVPTVDDFDQDSWMLDQDTNQLQTLLPYSAAWANDGVAYAGLQDNGTMRVDPAEDLHQFETIGADGTFVAVDPGNSDYAFESIQGGLMNRTNDGGRTWTGVEPPADNKRFVNPFVMDPLDPQHIVTGGQQINETLDGETETTWLTVFDLGTAEPPEGTSTEDLPDPPSNGMTAIDTRGDVTYVGYCGPCDALNTPYPFRNGIATNIGGEDPPKKGTPDGWHKVVPTGLPNRFITSLAIDPEDETNMTVYATLGGYSRQWVGPGTLSDTNDQVGEGHVYKSVDGGKNWFDVSGDLPDIPALWVEPRGDQLIIGTDQGVFLSSDDHGEGPYTPLPDVPATPITSIQLKPNDPNQALIGSYGRSLWAYEFDEDPIDLPEEPPPPIVCVEDTTLPPTGDVIEGPFGFEADAEGWTTESGSLLGDEWERTSPGANGSEFSFGIAPYRELADTSLISPELTAPGGPVFLQWSNKYDVEGGGFDEADVEWSSDGTTWIPATVLGGQNVGYPDFGPNLALIEPPEGPLTVRFHFHSDEICSSAPLGGPLCARQDGYEGMFIDDVQLRLPGPIEPSCPNPNPTTGGDTGGDTDGTSTSTGSDTGGDTEGDTTGAPDPPDVGPTGGGPDTPSTGAGLAVLGAITLAGAVSLRGRRGRR